MIRLIQEFGAHTGRQLSFDQERVRIGRAPGSDVPFDPNVDLDSSGNHCEIFREGGAYWVHDVQSRNGTYVNGQRIQKQRLNHGDVLECGRGGPRLRIELQPTTANAGTPALTAQGPGAPPIAPPGFGPPPASPGGNYGVGPASPSGPYGAGPVAPSGSYGMGAAAPSGPYGAPYGPAAPSGKFAPPAPQGPTGFGPAPAAPAPFGAPSSPGPFGAPAGSPSYAAGPNASGGFAANAAPRSAMPGPNGAGPSVGAAVAAALPAGAQVGKRTVAMMIDQALAQSGAKRSSTGLKVAMGLTIAVVLGGLGVGGWFLYDARQQEDAMRASGGGTTDDPGSRITGQYEAAIYMVAAQRPGAMPQGFCTGFAVTQDLLATNAHCVDVAQEMIAQGKLIVALRNNGRGAQVYVQPVFRDQRFRNPAMGMEGSGYDVGLLRAAQPLQTAVRLASVDEAMGVRPGVHIYVYGFPGLTMNEVSPVATITEGVLNRSTDFFDRAADAASAQKVQHSAQTTSGSSGSPIFLANGNVIAINAGSLADQEQQSIVDPTTGRRTQVAVSRSSNFKYGMRSDLIRMAIQSVGEMAP